MMCQVEGCGRPVENHDTGLCATHSRASRKTVTQKKAAVNIKSISKKQSRHLQEYSRAKRDFFSNPRNRICKVCGMNGADSIHHSKGKVGFADEWARGKGITLLNDIRHWIPVHSFYVNPDFGVPCHRYIEDRPEFARKIGVTSSRHTKE